MNANSKKTKKQKLLLALLLFLVPVGIVIFLIIAMTGKKPELTKLAIADAFNSKLPSPKLDQKDKNKLEIYLDAQRDSLKRKEQEDNDPNIKRLFNPGPPDPQPFESELSLKPTGKQHPETSVPLDANEKKIDERLKKLLSALNEQSPPDKTNNLPLGQPFPATNNSTEKLEKLLQIAHQPDTTTDRKMQQLSEMLSQLVDIEHPERAVARTQHPNNNDLRRTYDVSSAPLDDQVNNDYPAFTANSLSDDNGFYGFTSDPDTISRSIPEHSILAVVHETQTVESGSTVKLRLLQDVFIGGMQIKKGSFIFGKCSIDNQRVDITLSSISSNNRILPISLKVFDATDGMVGIPVFGDASLDVAKNGASQGLQSVGMSSLDPSLAAQATTASIETAKTLLTRKIRTVKVTLKAGHYVLLKA